MASAPRRPRAPVALVLALLAATLAAVPQAHALRIVSYNLTNYPGTSSATRDPHFRNILDSLAADVVVVQEMHSQAGVNQFLANLDAFEPGQWRSARFYDGNDTDNALFFKPASVDTLGSWAFYPNPAHLLRYVTCWRLRPAGTSSVELRIYSQHLKASSGSANEAQRLAEAIGIRDSMNAVPQGTHSILLGDFNIYRSSEPAFMKLLEDQADDDGRLYDPLNAVGTWNNAGFAAIHTQCPCLTCPGGSGFAGGGLDDRFDMFLPTSNLNDGEGLDLLVATYRAVGNDGLHYDKNLTDAPAIPEGQAFATSLWTASDHLPIRVDVQLPARLDAPASLALGTVIGGGAAALSIGNAAPLPADELNYWFAAPPGFTAPPGAYALAPGAPAARHGIETAPGPAGPRAGDLVVTTDDPDAPARVVALTATVLDHASASLDSIAIVTSATLEVGDPGGNEGVVRVHNRGFHAAQARLAVKDASIVGGGGRFALVPSFAPALVGAAAHTVGVRFEAAGAVPDSEYVATLVLSSADEPLPGADAQPDLVVTLRARAGLGTVGVPAPGRPPHTALHAPFPNPLARTTTLRFDLARAGAVRLEVFDLSGRRLATLVDARLDPGRHEVAWDGRLADGTRAAPGVCFVRLAGPTLAPQSRRLAVVR